jgi:hypothetical protein
VANAKITQLPALTTADPADLLCIVDDVAGTPVTKKITIADLFTSPTLVTPTLGAASGTSLVLSTDYPVLTIHKPTFTADEGAIFYQNTNGSFEIDVYPNGLAGAYLNLDPTTNALISDNLQAQVAVSTPAVYGVTFPTEAIEAIFPSRTKPGFFQLKSGPHVSGSSPDNFVSVAFLPIAPRDPSNGYFDANVRFNGTTLADDTSPGTIKPTYSVGSEGVLAGDGTLSEYRLYVYDHVNDKTLAFIDHSNPALWIYKTDLQLNDDDGHGNLYVQGLSELPTVIGGSAVGSSLTLQSTSAVGTTDSIVMKVGNNGGTTGLTINHDGTIQAGVGYKSSDGTAGATAGPFTVITGITVKNGLVTALTGS